MTTAQEQLPQPPPADAAAGPTPDQLRQGDLPTQISRPLAWCMIVSFLAIVFGVPICQIAMELRSGQQPGVLAIFDAGRFPARADLKQFEDSLQDQSAAIQSTRPSIQEWLCEFGHAGSGNVVVGRNDWLYYRPGIDYVIGPGFLDPATLRRRSRHWRDAAIYDEIHPDPRPAILEFKQIVEAAGARLILMPTPDKAALQFNLLAPRQSAQAPVRNASFAQFVREMNAAGVEVFDPSPAAIEPGEIRYLIHDTHWTPAFMQEAARLLAERLRARIAPRERVPMRLESQTVSCDGDLAQMLRLRERQTVFLPQTVAIQRVLDASGRAIRPDASSPVLLLGDSFTNIYSTAQMEWGDAAGFAEHLSSHLGRPIDWLARNDAGAHATREMLYQQMIQGRNRLAGKTIVIWQFAERELAVGDWRLLGKYGR